MIYVIIGKLETLKQNLSSSDISWVKMIVEAFKELSCFSGLKPNFTKCETAGLSPLKRVVEAVCGFKNVDLTNDAVKILRIHFLYHDEIKTAKALSTVKNILKALNMWNTRTLTLEKRFIIFKTLAVS